MGMGMGMYQDSSTNKIKNKIKKRWRYVVS
jgi:hypothetical protein